MINLQENQVSFKLLGDYEVSMSLNPLSVYEDKLIVDIPGVYLQVTNKTGDEHISSSYVHYTTNEELELIDINSSILFTLFGLSGHIDLCLWKDKYPCFCVSLKHKNKSIINLSWPSIAK